VLEDVIDGFVSVERARKDYGVVIRVLDEEILSYRVDLEATDTERNHIRENRIAWMREDPHAVQEKFVKGEIDELDGGPAPRRHPGLGRAQGAAQNHGAIPRDDRKANRGVLEVVQRNPGLARKNGLPG